VDKLKLWAKNFSLDFNRYLAKIELLSFYTNKLDMKHNIYYFSIVNACILLLTGIRNVTYSCNRIYLVAQSVINIIKQMITDIP